LDYNTVSVSHPSRKSMPKPPGPDPDRLVIEGNWESAVQKAMHKVKPTNGWPKPEPKPRKPKPDPSVKKKRGRKPKASG
jgi:hypothetical protein